MKHEQATKGKVAIVVCSEIGTVPYTTITPIIAAAKTRKVDHCRLERSTIGCPGSNSGVDGGSSTRTHHHARVQQNTSIIDHH